MKKILSVLLASMMICSLCACGETTQSSTGATSENSNAITAPPTSEVKEDDGKGSAETDVLEWVDYAEYDLKEDVPVKNIVNAIEVARCMGVKTLSLTGRNESKLSDISNVTICVPETETYKVQELHLPVYHYLCAEVEKEMFKK